MEAIIRGTYKLRTHCDRRGEKLSLEEFYFPYLIDGEMVCDECYERWEEEFNPPTICPLCEEHFWPDEGCPPNSRFVILEELEDEDLTPGYYKIIDLPFFADGMIEAYFITSRFRKIRQLDGDEPSLNDYGYSASFICDDCARKKGLFRLLPWSYGQPWPAGR